MSHVVTGVMASLWSRVHVLDFCKKLNAVVLLLTPEEDTDGEFEDDDVSGTTEKKIQALAKKKRLDTQTQSGSLLFKEN